MALPALALRFIGIQALDKAFDEILNAALDQKQRGQWYVASAAEYGEILEWRTPHWRVAIQMLADDVTLDTKQQQDYLNAMVAGGSMTKKVALSLKARVRRLIRQYDLIDTGNYLASIAIGPSVGEAFINSEDQLLDPSTSILAD